MQTGYPMPWADTGLPAPNNYTNGAGVYDFSGGVATTSSQREVHPRECRLRLQQELRLRREHRPRRGGVNGEHGCDNSALNESTGSGRSLFYELNKLAEVARGWLPLNTWLRSQLTANTNINSTCNAFWNGTTINFYTAGHRVRAPGRDRLGVRSRVGPRPGRLRRERDAQQLERGTGFNVSEATGHCTLNCSGARGRTGISMPITPRTRRRTSSARSAAP